MWTHLLETMLNGFCLFAGPVTLIAAMGAGLTLIDRLAHFLGRNDR